MERRYRTGGFKATRLTPCTTTGWKIRGFLQSGPACCVAWVGFCRRHPSSHMTISLSSPLSRYLADMSRPGREATPSQHLERGAECVLDEDMAALTRLRPALEAKLAGIGDSTRLKERVGLLLRYLEEAPADPGN